MTPDELIEIVERGYPNTYCETCGQLVCQSCGYCKNLHCKDCNCIELRRSCGFPDGTKAKVWEEFLRRQRKCKRNVATAIQQKRQIAQSFATARK
jgi:hypothetical protein